MSDWQFFAQRLNGDGTETLIAADLPLEGAKTERAVSGPGGVTGSIPVEVARLRGTGGRPIFEPWSTAIYAHQEGYGLRGGILTPDGLTKEGQTLKLETTGFSVYPAGLPYRSKQSWVQVDPADLIREAWSHVQGQTGGDLAMVVDDLSTDIRIGTEEEENDFTTEEGEQVQFTSGPIKWNWWSTHDLGNEIDTLCDEHAIEYVEHHRLDGEEVTHRLQLGHPRIGRRRHDLRFKVGEGVIDAPPVGASAYASEVIVLGAGEGRKMRRGTSSVKRQGRLRRPLIITDKSLQSNAECERVAATELRRLQGGDSLEQLMIAPHAQNGGTWTPGDEILVQGDGKGWASDLHLWVRIVSETVDCNTGIITLGVQRAGRT